MLFDTDTTDTKVFFSFHRHVTFDKYKHSLANTSADRVQTLRGCCTSKYTPAFILNVHHVHRTYTIHTFYRLAQLTRVHVLYSVHDVEWEGKRDGIHWMPIWKMCEMNMLAYPVHVVLIQTIESNGTWFAVKSQEDQCKRFDLFACRCDIFYLAVNIPTGDRQ